MDDHEKIIAAARHIHDTFEGRDIAIIVFNDNGAGECVFGTTHDEVKCLTLIKIMRSMLEGMENAILAQKN